MNGIRNIKGVVNQIKILDFCSFWVYKIKYIDSPVFEGGNPGL